MDCTYLVLYDIASAKRIRRAATIILDYGIRIQKSVYEVRLSEQTRADLLRRLAKVIDPDEDGVKIFPMCASCAPLRSNVGQKLPKLISSPWLIL